MAVKAYGAFAADEPLHALDIQRRAPGQGRDSVRHPPRLAVVQKAVEQRPQHRPGRARRQLRRTLGDQDVDDVIAAPSKAQGLGGRSNRHGAEDAPASDIGASLSMR